MTLCGRMSSSNWTKRFLGALHSSRYVCLTDLNLELLVVFCRTGLQQKLRPPTHLSTNCSTALHLMLKSCAVIDKPITQQKVPSYRRTMVQRKDIRSSWLQMPCPVLLQPSTSTSTTPRNSRYCNNNNLCKYKAQGDLRR